MLKLILIILAVIVVGVAIYYGRFLVTKKVVREEIPAGMQAGEPKTLGRGSFRDIDFIHKGSGDALILEDAGGGRVLRLQDFKVTNGPDLFVYLTRNPAPTNKESLGDFISVARLKGNVGDQNYDLPQNIEGYRTVVIWCQQFSALFSYATLQ